MRHNFQIPKIPFGYVFVLVSIRSENLSTFYISETEDLSRSLREINSTSVANDHYLYGNQPWSVGFFYWGFNSEDERLEVLSVLNSALFKKKLLLLIRSEQRAKNIYAYF